MNCIRKKLVSLLLAATLVIGATTADSAGFGILNLAASAESPNSLDLTVSSDNGTVTLSWNDIGAESYDIYCDDEYFSMYSFDAARELAKGIINTTYTTTLDFCGDITFGVFAYNGTEIIQDDTTYHYVDGWSMVKQAGNYQYVKSIDGGAIIVKYLGFETEITLPEQLDGLTVTEIAKLPHVEGKYISYWYADNPFYNVENTVTSITLPSTLQKIGTDSFWYCKLLTSMTIPASVTSIDCGSAFHDTKIENLYVDPENTFFADIDGVLTNKEKTSFLFYPIYRKASHYTVPDGITDIAYSAFSDCNNLISVILPESLETIHNFAFDECKKLSFAHIPAGVTSIWTYAFYECPLKYAYVPNDTTTIGERAFGYYYDNGYNTYEDFTIYGKPNSSAITYANDNGFNNSALPSKPITWANSEKNNVVLYWTPVENATEYEICVKTADGINVDEGTYACTDTLSKYYTYVSGLTANQEYRFAVKAKVNDSWTVVEDGDYVNCIFRDKAIGEQLSDGTYKYTVKDDYTLSVSGSERTDMTEINIPAKYDNADVTEIGDNTFSGTEYSKVTSLILPNTIKRVGENSFRQLGLSSVVIPDSVETIEWYSFSSLKNLTSVSIGSGLKTIVENALSDNTKLSAITVSADNENFCSSNNVLYSKDSTKLILYPHAKSGETFSVPDSVTAIGYHSICGRELKTVNLGANVTDIDPRAFEAWYLTAINIADDNPNYTSYNNAVLNKAKTELVCLPRAITALPELPDTVTTFGQACMIYRAIKNLVVPSSVTELKDSACFNMGSLENVTIPGSVKTIGYYAFGHCYKLSSLTLGDGIEEIAQYVFYGNEKLKSVYIPSGVTKIGAKAFGYYNSSLIEGFTIYGEVGSAAETYAKENSITFVQGKPPVPVTKPAVTATPGDESITLTWGAVANATKYAVSLYENNALSDYSTEITSTSFTILELENGKSYTFVVKAYIDGKWSEVTNSDYVTAAPNGHFVGQEINDGTYKYSIKEDNKLSVIGVLNNQITALNIPLNYENMQITTIGASSFVNCTSLTSISLSAAVSSIEEYAFYNCENLKAYTLSAGVGSIGAYSIGYYQNAQGTPEKYSGITINGVTGSAAEKYATDNGFTFVSAPSSTTAPASTTTEPTTTVTVPTTTVTEAATTSTEPTASVTEPTSSFTEQANSNTTPINVNTAPQSSLTASATTSKTEASTKKSTETSPKEDETTAPKTTKPLDTTKPVEEQNNTTEAADTTKPVEESADTTNAVETTKPVDQLKNPEETKPVEELEIGDKSIDEVAKEIEEIANDESKDIKVELSTETLEDASELINAVKGKDVELTLDCGDFSWSIDGASVTGDIADMNLNVNFGTENIPTEKVSEKLDKLGITPEETVQISLAHNGELGFDGTLNYKADKSLAGKKVVIYYFNEETGELEISAVSEVDEDGNILIGFKHASEYLLVMTDEFPEEAAIAVKEGKVNISDKLDVAKLVDEAEKIVEVKKAKEAEENAHDEPNPATGIACTSVFAALAFGGLSVVSGTVKKRRK